MYRFLPAFMALIVLISSSVSAFAVPAVPPEVASFLISTFGGWALGKILDDGSDYIKDHIGYSAGKVCASSEDGYHHCDKAAFGHGTGGTDDDGRYSLVTCKYCGETFKYYSSYTSGGSLSGTFGGKTDFEQSYDAQVQQLSASAVDDAGFLYYISSPPVIRFDIFDNDRYSYSYYWNAPSGTSSSSKNFSVSLDTSGSSVVVSARKSAIPSIKYCTLAVGFDFIVPIDGYYFFPNGLYGSAYYLDSSGNRYDFSPSREPYYNDTGTYYSVGQHPSAYCYLGVGYPECSTVFAQFSALPPVIKIQPLSGLIDPVGDTTYNINSRPTSITGDFGIIGDNGEITKVEGDTIVDESKHTVYNPVTNTTSNVTDWQYDYSTRTYNLTLDNGTTQTVTYGDENVSIQEGDTTYNVYYLVANTGSGSDTPGTDTPAPCTHSWSETSSTAATCTVAGSRRLICTLCNETKTETIPAPGHTWQIKQTVTTQYDETGQLTQQGYTIFECSVCHQQYKSEDGAAPPGGGTGTDPSGDSLLDKLGELLGSGLGGIVELVGAAASKLLDALIALVEMITGKLADVVSAVLSIFEEIPALFGGFLDFLSAVFPFLPSEIMALLTLGIAAVVFIGIIKALRR